MDRISIMQKLEQLYQGVLESGDARSYLDLQVEIEHLYDALYTMQGESYTTREQKMLEKLSELNTSLELLVKSTLDQMKKSHDLSSVIVQHYERPAYNDSYFFDKKY